ncbi:MAG: hypothetical protein IPO47_19455 [Bacteroidetes bacterium]|nr:hypothetical protein [Bacteroidota bacterium]
MMAPMPSAVVWIPKSQMYVTVVAGNAEFPLEGFSPAGTNIFSENANVDARGMWYNTKSGDIEINGAGEMGCAWIHNSPNKQAYRTPEYITRPKSA